MKWKSTKLFIMRLLVTEYRYDYKAPTINASYGWGYGFSYMSGVIITAKKMNGFI